MITAWFTGSPHKRKHTLKRKEQLAEHAAGGASDHRRLRATHPAQAGGDAPRMVGEDGPLHDDDRPGNFAYYDFCRIHQSLRVTPAMAAAISEHVWAVRDLI